ncbi:MAG: hypothetical protein AAFR93_08450 [Pseudomonadota bacterium]
MFDQDFILIAVKVLGTGLAGFFGLYGILHDFRDETGRVTRAGRIAIMGLGASILLTGLAETWDGLSARSESRAATERIERAITEIDRSLRQIEDVQVFVADLAVPLEAPEVAAYFATVKGSFEPEIELFRTGVATLDAPGPAVLVRSLTRSFDKVPISVRIPPRLLPDDDGSVLAGLLSVVAVHMHIYTANTAYEAIVAGDARPDLDITLYGDGRFFDTPLNVYYELDPESGDADSARLSISGRLTGPGPSDWTSNGKVISIPDLRGAWIALSFSPVGIGGSVENTRFLDLRAQMTLKALNLQVNARDVWLESTHFSQHRDAQQEPFWLTRLGADDPFATPEPRQSPEQ